MSLYGRFDGQLISLRDKDNDADDPKYTLFSSDLWRFRKRRRGSTSIFLLHGCRTAAPSPDALVVPISANFLKEMHGPGYCGFIGTEVQVSNVFACRYGMNFLWHLLREGRSVGEKFDEHLVLGAELVLEA